MNNIGSGDKSNGQTFWHFIVVFSLSFAIFSFVSPQVGMLGRGLRTTLPALAVSFFAISIISPAAFFRAFSRYWIVFLFGSLYLLQAALRFTQEDNSFNAGMLWHTYFLGPLMAQALLLWIAALAELGDDTVRRFRAWVLFGWCISLAIGLPVLIKHPEVARLTMGNIHEKENAAKWAPLGVGEYDVYTSLAICFAPLYAVCQQRLKGVWRWAALILTCLASTSVLFSTFTMAAVQLVASIFAALAVWAMSVGGFRWLLRVIPFVILISISPIIYSQAKMIPQTEFITSKVERLYKRISRSGLEKGDETKRGKMFMEDIRHFRETPLVGYIPNVQGYRDHGHSSLANSLVLFGLFGSASWIAVLYMIFKDFLRNTGTTVERRFLCIGWLVLALGGILNPTWHAPAMLIALFALTLPARKYLDAQINPAMG